MLAKHRFAAAALLGIDDDCFHDFMLPCFYQNMQTLNK
jgi:hypothetical protein